MNVSEDFTWNTTSGPPVTHTYNPHHDNSTSGGDLDNSTLSVTNMTLIPSVFALPIPVMMSLVYGHLYILYCLSRMKGVPLDHLNSTLASALGHIYDSLITYTRLQDETAVPSKSILLSFFGRNIIILSTLLVIGLALGLGALVWAGRVLKRHYDDGCEVSVIVLSLLLTDLLELLVLPVVLTSLLNVLSCYTGLNCLAAIMAFGFARQCGYCFHQLVALEGVLALRQPDGSTRLSAPRFAIPASLLVWIWALVTVIMSTSTPLISFLMGYVMVIATIVLTLISSILTYVRCLHTDRKPGKTVNAIALFTLVFLYGPFIAWLSLLQNGLLLLDLGFISIGAISFRLALDPLLCVLVCRNKSLSTRIDVRTSHTHIH